MTTEVTGDLRGVESDSINVINEITTTDMWEEEEVDKIIRIDK